jgi:3-isopropylmalate dehydrogenase
VLCVGESADWRAAVEKQGARWSGLEIEEASFSHSLARLRERPETLDVVVTEAHFVEAMIDSAAHYAGLPGSVAQAWLPEDGPGVFFPGASEPGDVAGFGVVDPRGMLLTASLMLAEGLKRRSASRTLERAVTAAARRNVRAMDDTRSFTDAVIELLPSSRVDLEHFDEVWA